MEQGPLCKVIKRMLKEDTGTNVHIITVFNTNMTNIRKAWDIIKRDDNTTLKIIKVAPGDYTIQINRPVKKDKNITII